MAVHRIKHIGISTISTISTVSRTLEGSPLSQRERRKTMSTNMVIVNVTGTGGAPEERMKKQI
jgi:hypothetical protein